MVISVTRRGIGLPTFPKEALWLELWTLYKMLVWTVLRDGEEVYLISQRKHYG